MRRVALDMQGRDGEWHQLSTLSEQQPRGSISSTDIHGVDQVYVFGWHQGEGPAVWRSIGGVDVADPEHRLILTTGLDIVADLKEGPFTMRWRRPQAEVSIRFRLIP